MPIRNLRFTAPPQFDAATSDFLLKNDGFFGSFELQNHGNRFVQGRSF
jgi:hypothetical protein